MAHLPHHLDAEKKAALVVEQARELALKISIAESCTGGLLGAALTAIPGASDVFDRGFITYSNAAKHDLLGVPEALIRQYGAVSEEVAGAMAEGLKAVSGSGLAVAITGIAGPGGGTEEKPVGLVHIAAASRLDLFCRGFRFTGDRAAIRAQAVDKALDLLQEHLVLLSR